MQISHSVQELALAYLQSTIWGPLYSECKARCGFIVVRHISRSPQEGLRLPEFDQSHGWSFMDLTSRRWYTITHSWALPSRGCDDITKMFSSGVLAMDGGLVCEVLKSEHLKIADVFVYNPVLKNAACTATVALFSQQDLVYKTENDCRQHRPHL